MVPDKLSHVDARGQAAAADIQFLSQSTSSVPTSTPAPDPTAASATMTAPPPQQIIINNPVIEHVVEKAIPQQSKGSDAVSPLTLATLLVELRSELLARISGTATSSIPQQVAAAGNSLGYYFAPASQRIDQLQNTAINTPTITSPSISGGSISNTSIAGYLPLVGGTLTGNLTGTNLNLSGTLTAGTLTVAGLSSGGALTGPYFTATSTTQATTFNFASTTALSVSGTGYFGTATSTNLFATTASLGSLSLTGAANAINSATPASYTTPGFNFNDLGTSGFSFPDTTTHFAMTIEGNKSGTGTGSYEGLIVTQYCQGMHDAGYCTGAQPMARAVYDPTNTWNKGNFSGNNPYVYIPSGMSPNSVVGEEIDTETHSTAYAKEGLRIADINNSTGTATWLSTAIQVMKDSGSSGFSTGLNFGETGDSQFPVASGGTLVHATTSSIQLSSAMDFSAMAGGFSTGAIILPAGGSNSSLIFGPTKAGGGVLSQTTTNAGTLNFASGITTLQFGATNSLIADSVGNVYVSSKLGIGTTTPNAQLQVQNGGTGTLYAFGNLDPLAWSASANLGTNTSAPEGLGIGWNRSAGSRETNFINTAPGYTPGGFTFDTWDGTTYAQRVKITSSGNVGIGTTSPASNLSVAGNGYFTGGLGVGTLNTTAGTLQTSGNATFGGGSLTLNNGTSNTIFYGNIASAVPGANSVGEKIQLYGTAGTVASTDYALGIENNNMWFNSNGGYKWYENSSQKMTLDSNGNIGIGTTTPASLFSVAGSGYLTGGLGIGTNSPTTGLYVANAVSSGALTTQGIALGTSVGYSDQEMFGTNGNLIDWSAASGHDYDFRQIYTASTNDFQIVSSSTPTILDIKANGNVGIGTTTPNDTLTIAASAASQIALTDGTAGSNEWTFRNAGGILYIATSTYSATSSVSAFKLDTNGNLTIIGSATTCTIGNGTSATSCSSSDQRLKDDITSLATTSGLAAINALNPVSFHWNQWMQSTGNSTSTQFGFVAQQVQQVFPNLVEEDPNTHYYKLDYQGLIAPIIKAIQEIASVSGTFRQNLIAWLGDSANGIDKIFAKDIYATNGAFDTLTAHHVHSDELCAGSVCVNQQQLAALLAALGQQPATTSPSTTPPNATTSAPILQMPPAIQINGTNPATLHIGDSYADLGATITGPQQDLNLGIHTFLNGTLMDPIQLDTSTTSTSTIDYVVTDQWGQTATATRMVVVQ